MIISKDIHPERDLYYLGGKLIELLANSPTNTIDFFDAFDKMKTTHKISLNLFTLTLDWLYIIGVIEKNSTGNIVRCF